ncbi:DUF397 domain-containing protein [Spirillospora sp. NPDC050679]
MAADRWSAWTWTSSSAPPNWRTPLTNGPENSTPFPPGNEHERRVRRTRQGQGECVEVSINVADATLIRDSKDPSDPRLVLGRDDVAGLLGRIKAGAL